jgi:hypothetical protein
MSSATGGGRPLVQWCRYCATIGAMISYPYLSPDWIEAVGEIRKRRVEVNASYPQFVVNYTISDIPFLDGGTADFHTDIRSPHFFERGHDADASLTVRTDYETARRIYRDSTWSLDRLRESYGSGAIAIEGDLELIPQWWTEVVSSPDQVAMYDEIMMMTA